WTCASSSVRNRLTWRTRSGPIGSILHPQVHFALAHSQYITGATRPLPAGRPPARCDGPAASPPPARERAGTIESIPRTSVIYFIVGEDARVIVYCHAARPTRTFSHTRKPAISGNERDSRPTRPPQPRGRRALHAGRATALAVPGAGRDPTRYLTG